MLINKQLNKVIPIDNNNDQCAVKFSLRGKAVHGSKMKCCYLNEYKNRLSEGDMFIKSVNYVNYNEVDVTCCSNHMTVFMLSCLIDERQGMCVS